MASDSEIAQGLDTLFREINPNSFTSVNDVVLQLQSKLGCDLTHKIDFIRAQISFLFNSTPPNPLPSHPSSINHNSYPNLNSYHGLHQPITYSSPHSQFSSGFGVRGPTQISFAQPGGTAVEFHTAPPKESTQTRPKRRGGPGGLNKLCGVSPLLQPIVGQPEMPRTEIVRQLWAYIRKHNLQDPSNKRKIVCNDELRLVFETDSTDMFQMNKLLSKHIVPLAATKGSGQPSKKLKVEESEASNDEPSPSPASDPCPTSEPGSALPPAPIMISEALANFFGISEKQMLQSEVFKRVEDYIKVEGLEDSLTSMVMCDTKLQKLFGCASISTTGVREALARNHLFPKA